MLEIVDFPIDVAAIIARVEAPGAGAVNAFVGTVRNQAGGRPVQQLRFEAYVPMALRQLAHLEADVRRRWPMVQGIAVTHRIGTLAIGDVAVVVAVSTPHRPEAFAACQYLIDTLKQTVPIWKYETYEDGTEWVAAHP
jgi:molybdopterin synthase catalytic subunit